MKRGICAVLLAAAVAAGCGRVERDIAGLTGFSRICIDEVLYYQFTSGASVAYTPDGKIRTCK